MKTLRLSATRGCRILPLHIRMCLFFLLLRRKEFTQEELTPDELAELRAYAQGKPTRNMYLAFGRIHYHQETVADRYDFAPAPYTSLLNLLINLLCIYHKLGYKGYPVRISLLILAGESNK